MSDAIYCPDCPPWTTRGGQQRRHVMECIERNYSGCGVDYYACPECGHAFCVSYKVDTVERDEAWDCPSREQQEASDARLKREAEDEERAEYEKLKAKFGDRP